MCVQFIACICSYTYTSIYKNVSDVSGLKGLCSSALMFWDYYKPKVCESVILYFHAFSAYQLYSYSADRLWHVNLIKYVYKMYTILLAVIYSMVS